MENYQEGVAITPNEEVEETATEAADVSSSQSEQFGLANDGTQYSEDSDAVAAYLAAYPGASLEAAIGSCVMAHNRFLDSDAIDQESPRYMEIIHDAIYGDNPGSPVEEESMEADTKVGAENELTSATE